MESGYSKMIFLWNFHSTTFSWITHKMSKRLQFRILGPLDYAGKSYEDLFSFAHLGDGKFRQVHWTGALDRCIGQVHWTGALDRCIAHQ